MQAEGNAERPECARGHLRVYLGAAPGVGKTFSMLDEGHRRHGRGTDVVIGLVETHGRPKTIAEIGDLEIVPRKKLSYRGTEAEEMDLDAIVARDPDVVLIDELAHTNIPGGRHEKRWEDVDVILDHGIDVITTVNVQHLESLNDVVESITGVRQRETIPDAVVRAADQVELVDMSPQALRRRMAHGNIYAPEKVDTALSRYFREGNLTALREIALLWLADRVEEGMDRYREAHGIDDTWATRERIVASVTGGPESATLMRRASRIASRSSGAEWMAVYITRRDGLSGVSTAQLEKIRLKAHDLGGSFHVVVGDEVPDALLDFARGVNATQILIGASRRNRWSSLLRPGIGEGVIAASGDIDIHVVTHDYAHRTVRQIRRDFQLSGKRRLAGYLLGTVGTVGFALGLYVTPDWHSLPVESALMTAMVVATALVGGLLPAIICALLSGALLNFLFTAPHLTLIIADPQNTFTIIVFLVVGIAVASVVDLAARRTGQATRARAEANALAVLSHSLLHSEESEQTLLTRACEVFGMAGAAVLEVDAGGDVTVISSCGDAPTTVEQANVDVPIEGNRVLAMKGRPLNASDRRLLGAYAGHAAILAERRQAADDAVRTTELAEGNKTRTALLAAVSHDLRNPLAAIKAAVSSLRSDDIAWAEEDEAELLETIEESADRLDTLIGNLLDMSRLQMGKINPLITDLEVAHAVKWAIAPLNDDRLRIQLEPDLPSASADPGLLDRVIANVVENALKHTPSDARVDIGGSTWLDEDHRQWVSVRVVDHGPGVPDDSKATLFAPFQRLGDVPNGDGLGLGLAVARGLTESMGGTLSAEDTPAGGLTMVIDLPAAVSAVDTVAVDAEA